MYVCVHTHVHVRVQCVRRCPGEAKGGLQIPWSWSCKQLYELSNVDPVIKREKQHALSITETSLQLRVTVIAVTG